LSAPANVSMTLEEIMNLHGTRSRKRGCDEANKRALTRTLVTAETTSRCPAACAAFRAT
jgi:hypothetical protein